MGTVARAVLHLATDSVALFRQRLWNARKYGPPYGISAGWRCWDGGVLGAGVSGVVQWERCRAGLRQGGLCCCGAESRRALRCWCYSSGCRVWAGANSERTRANSERTRANRSEQIPAQGALGACRGATPPPPIALQPPPKRQKPGSVRLCSPVFACCSPVFACCSLEK